MAGGRTPKTLEQRVLDRTFRPERYGELLAGPLLPKQGPFTDERRQRIWRELRELQAYHQLHAEEHARRPSRFDGDAMYRIEREFSALTPDLHGGRKPAWYEEPDEDED